MHPTKPRQTDDPRTIKLLDVAIRLNRTTIEVLDRATWIGIEPRKERRGGGCVYFSEVQISLLAHCFRRQPILPPARRSA